MNSLPFFFFEDSGNSLSHMINHLQQVIRFQPNSVFAYSVIHILLYLHPLVGLYIQLLPHHKFSQTTSSTMSDHKKNDKSARDDARMFAIAISIAIDGSINPAIADPSPSPRRTDKTITLTTGLAKAGESLTHSLTTGVKPLALVVKPGDNFRVRGGKKGGEEVTVKDGLPDSGHQAALTVKDAGTVKDATSKKGKSMNTAQGTDPGGSVPVSAVGVEKKKETGGSD